MVLCAAGEYELFAGLTYAGRSVWPGPRPANAVIIPLLALPLVWRRRRPLAACLAGLSAITIASAVLGGGEATTEFVLIIVVVYSGAAYADRPVAVGAAAAVAGVVHALRDPAVKGVGDVVWAVGLLIVAFMLGRAVHARQSRITAMQREALLREREHALAVAAAAAAERAAIARELHDIVAHAVSVVVIQSQAGARALPACPDIAARTLLTIEETARTALTDLRRLLTVLGDAESNDTQPRPLGSLAQLEELINTFRASGLDVRLNVPLDLPRLSAAAELAGYRVVQEALTNAARYARGSTVDVTLTDFDGAVTVTVEDCGGQAIGRASELGTGRGLTGMQQRLELVGGRLLEAGLHEGGFRVVATIPIGENERVKTQEPVT